MGKIVVGYRFRYGSRQYSIVKIEGDIVTAKCLPCNSFKTFKVNELI